MVNIHQHIMGTGKPVVLVHGWAMHGGIWRAFAEQLAQRYKVICVDLPGHGHSQSIQPFNLESISTSLVEAIAEPACCWLGWSMGASVVLDVASRFPGRVNSLILLAGNPHFTKTGQWPGMSGAVLDSFAGSLRKDCQSTLMRFLSLQINHDSPEHKALLKALKAAVLACPTPDDMTLQAGLEILKTADLRAALASIDKPISAILGGRDTLVPVAVGQKMQALAPAMDLQVLEKAGHVPFLSHAPELLAIISTIMEQQ